MGNINLLQISSSQLRYVRNQEIRIIFQDPQSSLNPLQRVGEQILESLQVYQSLSLRAAKLQIYNLLQELEFEQVEKVYSAYPHELSGGQKQRIMIAQALITNPQLLICDEPTTALDPTIQKSIFDLLLALQAKSNMAILLISHDLGVIYNYSHQLYVIDQGKIVDKGNTELLFTAAMENSTRQIFALLGWKKNIAPLLGEAVNWATENNSLVSMQNVSFSYSSQNWFFGAKKEKSWVLKNISWALPQKCILGIVGESGSGKSTLVKVLLRLYSCSEGKIYWLGKEVSKYSEKKLKPLRKYLQMVFQDPYASLNPYQKVRQILTEPLLFHRLVDTRAQAINLAVVTLEKVGLDNSYLERYPRELSGGQRQRICIARALLLNPSVLICDEAIAALDLPMQKQIIELLLSIFREQVLSIIFISHDLELVKYLCHYVIVLAKGEIVEAGLASQVLMAPQHPYTRNLIQAILPLPKISPLLEKDVQNDGGGATY
ncbi:MAG: ABC transporter ATP-binding protein [Bacteroidia bacterium]|nr:ABC transporter ATP-binding protein [Bacteroidia bacterium]MDW8159438.1 ABC transporter ATP-binding protein [Bacteroidia bacterium]